MLKFQIVLVYYDRPHLVLNAFKSFNRITYPNYEIVIIDDGSPRPVEPIARQNLNPDVLNRTRFINTGDSEADKFLMQGSRHGQFINNAFENTDADILIVVCDDDALIPSSLAYVAEWFENNPDKNYCYGHIIGFNPETHSIDNIAEVTHYLNHVDPIMPSCQIDSSQGIFRIKAMIQDDVKYFWPSTRDLDAKLYTKAQDTWGECHFCGALIQYKAFFKNQLGARAETYITGDIND